MGKTLCKQNRQERKLFSIAKTSIIGFRQIHSGDYDETLTQVTLLYSIKDIWWFQSYKIWWMDFQKTLLKLFFKDVWFVYDTIFWKYRESQGWWNFKDPFMDWSKHHGVKNFDLVS